MGFQRTSATLVFLLVGMPCCYGQEDFDFLIAALETSRELWRSGEFEGQGVFVDDRSDSVTGSLTRDIEFSGAFDMASGSHRFDQSLPAWTSGSESTDSEDVTRTIESTDGAAVYDSRNERIDLHGRIDSLPKAFRSFDVRALGLYTWPHFQQGTKFEAVLQEFRRVKPASVERHDAGLWQISWVYASDLRRQVLWMDETQGYSPIKLVIEQRRNRDSDWNTEPNQLSEVAWKKVDEVWVPVSFSSELTTVFPPRNGTSGRTQRVAYRATINWLSVNGVVPESRFSIDSFGAANGTYVSDWKSGQPEVVAIVGSNWKPLVAAEPLTRRSLSPFIIGLVILLVLCFLIAVGRRGNVFGPKIDDHE